VPVIAGNLINELNRIEKAFILVLDDYHLIHEKALH
jgi:ATP/maltotriose-dependent transcriptional regulator MalT